jgi:hypothetical protein
MTGSILRGLEGSLETVLKRNRNALTKAAYLEILEYLFDEAGPFKRRVVSICLEDIRGSRTSPIGWQLYLQHATSIVLKAVDEGIVVDPIHEILDTLLQSEYEDVVYNTLTWKNISKYAGTKPKALYHITKRHDWERVLSLALQALSLKTIADKNGTEDKTDIGLEECCDGYIKSASRPVREGWIELAGYHAREVSSISTVLISGIQRHREPTPSIQGSWGCGKIL